MNLLSRKKKEETPSDVRKAYDSQINHFLRQVEGPSLNIFRQRDHPLESLLDWAESALDEKQKLEYQLDAQVKAYKEAKKKNDDLRRALEVAESQFRQASIDNRNIVVQYNNQITTLTREHSKSMEDSKRKHDYDMNLVTQRHENRLKTLNVEHSRALRQKDNHLETVKATNAKEVERLVGQLLVNQHVDEGWTDDKLKLNFRELQRLIELVTAPSNKELIIPKKQHLGPHLDPYNFLGREGRGKCHFLLKSTIWFILYEQFFSAPFGFGAFGPGEAQTQLMEVYNPWLKIIEGYTTSGNENFTIFHHDKTANNWRSATFQCINAALGVNGEGSPAPEGPLLKLSANNIDKTVDRVMSILSEVSSMSNSSIQSEMEDSIRQMAILGRDIALQFGVHSAQLRLLFPDRGEQIQIGEEFHDCEDGDCYKGSSYTVDLVTTLGLRKIGDGRSDMTSKRIIVPCDRDNFGSSGLRTLNWPGTLVSPPKVLHELYIQIVDETAKQTAAIMAYRTDGEVVELIELYEALDEQPSSVEVHENLLKVWERFGDKDMASGIASALTAIDPSNQAARRYLQNRQGKMSAAKPPSATDSVLKRTPRTEEDWLSAEKRLEEGYQSLKVEARLLREEIEAIHKLGGILANDEEVLSNLQAISEGRINAAVPIAQPLSARETAKAIMETPNRYPPLEPDAIRERLVRRKVLLQAALPESMEELSVSALAHIEREHLQKTYVNSETMLGDKIADIPKSNFFVSEDNYAWDMWELAQAIASNDGVMRNPLSKQMFSESDIRMIINHPLGKALKPLQIAQNQLKKGVRPVTIDWIAKLGRIMLEDQSVDTLPSRKAIDEFQAYVATLPEAEQKAISLLKIETSDGHTGQPFDYTIWESVRDAVANVTCFHKVGDFLCQAATYLKGQ
ncbi:hypothetical protein G7Y89_g13023 [Cudoniella acicularis]|uniref:Uncharacterized protein n=1 Tax=Cudoniella acicularis TaxID=354080 RepID=A0A8H4RAP8_9HELO|nr:hypothetical protein G7Y89_g13023 [Cudoniella acicularis]